VILFAYKRLAGDARESLCLREILASTRQCESVLSEVSSTAGVRMSTISRRFAEAVRRGDRRA